MKGVRPFFDVLSDRYLGRYQHCLLEGASSGHSLEVESHEIEEEAVPDEAKNRRKTEAFLKYVRSKASKACQAIACCSLDVIVLFCSSSLRLQPKRPCRNSRFQEQQH